MAAISREKPSSFQAQRRGGRRECELFQLWGSFLYSKYLGKLLSSFKSYSLTEVTFGALIRLGAARGET